MLLRTKEIRNDPEIAAFVQRLYLEEGKSPNAIAGLIGSTGPTVAGYLRSENLTRSQPANLSSLRTGLKCLYAYKNLVLSFAVMQEEQRERLLSEIDALSLENAELKSKLYEAENYGIATGH